MSFLLKTHPDFETEKIRVILRISENTFDLFAMVVNEKTDFEARKNKEDICPKNNIAQLYKGDPTYVGTLPVNSGMDHIFTDFQHSTWWDPLPVGKSVNMRSILRFTGKIATQVGSRLYKI